MTVNMDGVLDSLANNLLGLISAFASGEFWLGVAASALVMLAHSRISRPKLRVTGGGGGGRKLENGDSFRSSRITLTNDPSFLWGLLSVKRDPFRVSSARIYDPAVKKYEGHLMRWAGEPEKTPFRTEISVGEPKQLYTYGVHNGRVHHFSGESMNNIELSETLVEIGSERFLEIHITDILRRKVRIPFRISAVERRNSSDGMDVQFRVKTTLYDRLRDFWDGFRSMIRAFTRPNY